MTGHRIYQWIDRNHHQRWVCQCGHRMGTQAERDQHEEDTA